MTSEPRLLGSFETGTGDDFARFYADEHDGQVRRAALLLNDDALAHDVVADSFMVVYRRWATIDEPGPYLNRCVLNACRDAWRSGRRETTMAEPRRDGGDIDPVAELGDLLLGLPYRQRAAIVLRFYGRCSEAEIAQQLDCRPGTVGSLIHRGLRALRENLTTGEDPE